MRTATRTLPSLRRAALALVIALAAAGSALPLRAGPVEDAVADLQTEWANIKYKAPADQQEARYTALAAKARAASKSFPDRAEVLIWEGIVVSSLAGAKGERPFPASWRPVWLGPAAGRCWSTPTCGTRDSTGYSTCRWRMACAKRCAVRSK